MKLFLDSNIFLRLLVPENQKFTSECQKIFKMVKDGTIIPYTSDIVIVEVSYVLNKLYKIEKSRIIEWQKDLLTKAINCLPQNLQLSYCCILDQFVRRKRFQIYIASKR